MCSPAWRYLLALTLTLTLYCAVPLCVWHCVPMCRWVPCDYRPANPAKQVSTPGAGASAPWGWYSDKDKRPWV